MKLNCKFVDNQCGGLICFVNSAFPEINIEEYTNAEIFVYACIVLSEQINAKKLGAVLDQMPVAVDKIDLCLCGCASDSYIREIKEFKTQYNFRSIIVSIQDAYLFELNDDIAVGAEKWSSVISVDSLSRLDSSLNSTKDILRLEPYVNDVIDYIYRHSPKDELEKIILLDIWLQKNIQYVKARESKASDGVYICNDIDRESLIEDVLINHFGRCEDIAFTAAVVLNHPHVHIVCRHVISDKLNHSWNIVTCNGKEYICDFTHNITRNHWKIPGALKAKQYSSMFTLLGKKDAISKYGISDYYDCSNIAEESVNREQIKSAVEKLCGSYPLIFSDSLVLESYLQEG